VERFYFEGLGFNRLGGFVDHDGFDGIMLGHPELPYHLEFTKCHHKEPEPGDTQESLLVFYVPDRRQWDTLISHLNGMGIERVPSFNPYWDQNGATFVDPAGLRVVIQNSPWPSTH